MDINFEYYKIFYYVAKYKNITKAAAALGSSQPNVTRMMKLLENQLDCRLFTRGARGVSLTEEGEKLYDHVKIACRHLLNAQEEICSREAKGRGTVEIGATETALHLFLLDFLQDFKASYPKIRIKIHNHATPELVKSLAEGNLDAAVLTAPFDVSKSFQVKKLMDFQEILVGGTQYESLGEKKLELERFGEYPWIGLGRGTATYEFYKEFFIRRHIDMELDMEVATSGLMIPMIQNNLGIGFVPQTLAAPLIRKKKLVRIDLDCEIPAREIGAVADRGKGRSRAADIFYQYLKNRSCSEVFGCAF